jgi:hypothetical protein
MNAMIQRLTAAEKNWDLAVIYARGRNPISVEQVGQDYRFEELGILVMIIEQQLYPTPENYERPQSQQEGSKMEVYVKFEEIVSIEFFTKNRIQLVS